MILLEQKISDGLATAGGHQVLEKMPPELAVDGVISTQATVGTAARQTLR